MPRYKRVQMIGYQVTTAVQGVNGTASTSWLKPANRTNSTADKLSQELWKHLTSEGVEDDLKKRIQNLCDIMVEAKQHAKCEESDDTLKIFMAPEFYFRQAMNGGYFAKDYEVIKSTLRKLFKSDYFKDWLIIPGTIVWGLSAGGNMGKRKVPSNNTMFNSCMPYYNGEASLEFFKQKGWPKIGTKCSIVIEKAKISTIDSHPGQLWGDVNISAPWQIPDSQYLRSDKINKRLFMLDELSIGLEICLDHVVASPAYHEVGENSNTLSKALQAAGLPLNQLDIQLVTAAGMDFKFTSNNTKENGLGFLNNGYTSTTSTPYCSLTKGPSVQQRMLGHQENITAFHEYDVNSDFKIPGELYDGTKIACCILGKTRIYEPVSLPGR